METRNLPRDAGVAVTDPRFGQGRWREGSSLGSNSFSKKPQRV